MTGAKKTKRKLMAVNLPPALVRQVKVTAAQRGVTMRALVEAALRKELAA